jgi:hypothetical protein
MQCCGAGSEEKQNVLQGSQRSACTGVLAGQPEEAMTEAVALNGRSGVQLCLPLMRGPDKVKKKL